MTKPGTVIVVFKTHLDVGFTDLADRVVKRYFTDYIPKAIALADRLHGSDGPERFVWTTGSWLIYEYLEQASTAERKRMERAIEVGNIAWHALPFTTHTELMDPSLFRFGLGLSRELDRRFGKRTIAAKMTDVPGHTRSMVPYLAEAGVRFLHIGVNPACPAPDVPPTFVWQGPDGSDVMVMYGDGTYGGTHAIPGADAQLVFAHSGDNAGPPQIEGVVALFRKLKAQFPDSRVEAGTLDDFARRIAPLQGTLPVVRAELGDTWIHGVGTDPLKVAQFRELCRLRARWEKSGTADARDPRYAAFSRHLLLVPEHTWGMDEKKHLPKCEKAPGEPYMKEDSYEHTAFRRARRRKAFRVFESSWREQRAYIDRAVKALGDSSLGREAGAALQSLTPSRPARAGYTRLGHAPWTLQTAYFEVVLDEQSGVITGLKDHDGRSFASRDAALAGLSYQTFAEADYERFFDTYVRNMDDPSCREWAIPDLSKPDIDQGGAVAQMHHPAVRWAGVRSDAEAEHILVEATFAPDVCRRFGAPRRVTIAYRFPRATARIELELQWFDKSACRLPEALWLSFAPQGIDPSTWMMDKLGYPVSPLDVVRNGNRNLHAVGGGLSAKTPTGALRIESLDAPLVSPGTPRLLRFDNTPPDLAQGVHFNLYNNVWGTNFPMWYGEDARFRFTLDFEVTNKEKA